MCIHRGSELGDISEKGESLDPFSRMNDEFFSFLPLKVGSRDRFDAC